jgi:hypothetical protein
MKDLKAALTVAIIAALMLVGLSANAIHDGAPLAQAGTRVGEIGWQYDTFGQNLMVNVTPEYITTSDRITIVVTSKLTDVWIKQASIYGVVYPKDSVQFPFSFPFLRITDTQFKCVIEPFPLNGYDIDFYVVVYDYYFEPMDSRTFAAYSYSVQGSGWRNDTFGTNLRLEYWPMKVNATQDVEITISSINDITINGANLYITYVTPEGEVREGGWNFSKTNVNSTEMKRVIPGFPAGTNVTFWVTAWDQYNSVMTSRMYNYSVMGIAEYTNFPFEYTGESSDKSRWVPDDKIFIPLAGMCALGIPLFIYIYALNLKRKKRASDMLVAKKEAAAPEPKEVKEDG